MGSQLRKKKADPRQGDFLGLLLDGLPEAERLAAALIEVPVVMAPEPGAFDDDRRVRDMLNAMIDASPHGREEIAARMSTLCKAKISKVMIDSWTGKGKPNAFPAKYTRAFAVACEAPSDITERYHALALDGTGWRAVACEQARLARLGQCYALIILARREATRLMAEAQP
jgi:hypothetical protein